MLLPGAYGSIAIGEGRASGGDGTLNLHFALEIAGTALLKHLPDGDIMQYQALILDCAAPGYHHAMNCVYILALEYLWSRFAS
jgi:hypothetical protein